MIIAPLILLFSLLQPGLLADAADAFDGGRVTASKNRTLNRIHSDDAPPTVQLISPSGWEEWEKKSWQTIRWETSDDSGLQTVSLELSRDKITWTSVFQAEGGLPGIRDTVIKVLHDTCDVCWPRIVVTDSANAAYDTALSPLLIVDEPAITTFPFDSAEVGKPFGSRVTYENPLGGNVELTFATNLPAWVSTQGDSVFGIPVGQTRTDTIVAFLGVGGVAYDTLDLMISIFGSTLMGYDKKPAQASHFHIAISRLAHYEYSLFLAPQISQQRSPVQVELFDVAGKSLFTRWLPTREQAIRLPTSIPNGAYIMRARNAAGMGSCKVILF